MIWFIWTWFGLLISQLVFWLAARAYIAYHSTPKPKEEEPWTKFRSTL